MKAGDILELTGGDLAYGGETVCRAPDGLVVFVPLMAPGDRARVRIRHVRSGFARGDVMELLEGGACRVPPPCPYFGVCGGCQWQHVSLEAQRAAKTRIVRNMLAPLGVSGAVGEMRGGAGLRYRNRLILPLRAGRGGLRAGFFRARSHRLVEVESCAVQDPALWEAARAALGVLRSSGIQGYNEVTGRGLLKHLVVRRAAGTGEVGVVIVTSEGAFPEGPAIGEALMKASPAVAGVLRNVSPGRTNVILGREVAPLAGRPFLVERLEGLELKSSMASFFQANHEVTSMMLGLLRNWTRDETGGILDLFCGGGIMGLAASSRAAWLAGVEEEPFASADAAANADKPGLNRRFFETGRVEEVITRIAPGLEGLGTVILDPPRKGLEPTALDAVMRLPARRFIYISCDPATFARDLKGFISAGLRPVETVPLDMFPQTYHIELMSRIER